MAAACENKMGLGRFWMLGAILLPMIVSFFGSSLTGADSHQVLDTYTLDFATPCDPVLQRKLGVLDARLRERYGMTTNETAVGVLDLKGLRLALLDPDRI